MSRYKNCAVPECTSSTSKTPGKLYIIVPVDQKIRMKWLDLARRDFKSSRDAIIYFCEDHFDVSNTLCLLTIHYIGTLEYCL